MRARGRASAALLFLASVAATTSCGPSAPPWEELVSTSAMTADRRRVADALTPRSGANVLLITIDTCRADRVGGYGNHRIRTPNLDALAERGVVFSDALCQAPITLPSHCSIMTGLNPTAHGVRDNGRFHLDESATTLAEVFRANGYQTAAFVGAFPVASKFGLAQGFDRYADEIAGKRARGHGTILELSAREVTMRAADWIRHAPREGGENAPGAHASPFFTWVHYFDPHWPYDPPAPYSTQYTSFPYDGEIAFVDAQIGRLLDVLDEAGVAENTIVIVTSDHGEGLGEHQEFSHSVLLYDGAMRVPLIVAPAQTGVTDGGVFDQASIGERLEDAPIGRGGLPSRTLIVESQVRSIDIMPTILDLAAIAPHTPLDGIPLRDVSDEPLPASAAICYMETFAPWYSFQWSPLRAVRTSEWKFIEAPKSELYRISVDPRENDNLFGDEPRGRRAAWANALTAAGVERSASDEAEMDPQTVEGLRALGYIGAGQHVDQPRPETGANPKLPNPADLIGVYFQYFSPALERFTTGDYAGAIKFAKDGLALDPANIQGLITLGHAQHRMGQVAEARATYERIVALDPENSSAHFMIAAIAHQKNEAATAIREYRAAIAVDPMLLEARHDLAVLLMSEGKTAEAETLLLDAIAADSTFGAAHRTLGNLYRQSGRDADAFGAYVHALIANPNDPDAEKMVIGLAKDDAVSAVAFQRLEETWRAGARTEGLVIALAEVAYVRGEKSRARRVVDEAIAATPTAALYRVRAWMNKNDGRADLEVADLVAGVQAEPQNAEARANLASNYRTKERWDDARREYEECLALDPRNENALVGLGIVFAETKQLGRAIEMWEQAVRVNPNSPAKNNIDAARKMLAGQGVGG